MEDLKARSQALLNEHIARILEKSGGALTLEEVAALFKHPLDTALVQALQNRNQLFSFPINGTDMYPAFQFKESTLNDNGKATVRYGVAEVLEVLTARNISAINIAGFFVRELSFSLPDYPYTGEPITLVQVIKAGKLTPELIAEMQRLARLFMTQDPA